MSASDCIAIVGAGFSGAVIAHTLAQHGFQVEVHEARNHVAGNCFTRRDADTGIMVHVFGPHIFHTDNEAVWDFVNSFGELVPFTNRVKALTGGKVYSLPINLMTINQFFGRTFSPDEARTFIETVGDQSIDDPQCFEDQALRFLGRDLYEAFFLGYTTKQWGVSPKDLPASILKRLPVRFDYNDNYYASRYQGIPREGYTAIIDKMLDHPNIRILLESPFTRENSTSYRHCFYTGTLDSWFDNRFGRLSYRTLEFVEERHPGDFQGNAVINYCDMEKPWTRISEHKHFAPWEKHDDSIIFKEFSKPCSADDIPYYPVRLIDDKEMLARYVGEANNEANVTFAGRLGTYRYLDMHVAIAEALDTANRYIEFVREGGDMPSFVVDPLG